MDKLNHHMMILAREARGLTQGELAAAMNIGQGTLSKYETGFSVDPPDSFIDTLSSNLGYPKEFFFELERPYGLPPFHYRRRKKLTAKALAKIVADMNIRRLHLKKLLVSFDMKTKGVIPEIDINEYQGKGRGAPSIEDIARQVRAMWMLPRGPISNMIELLEANGGVVIPCDFGTDLIDAMSQRIEGLPVLFFINVNAPADRLRHTLAHELGHMVMHSVTLKSDEDMEDEADEFAGAFLLPADELRPQLRKFDLRQLANLKQYWKVSMGALAVRASRLNLITPYQSKMFWIEMSKLGHRKTEPYEPPKETPRLLRDMVAFHTNKLDYSHAQMARLLHLSLIEFQEIYAPGAMGDVPPVRPRLRIVK